MSWKPDQRPRRNPDAAFRNYDGQAVVVLPGKAEINVLNPVGGRIFDLLDGKHTIAEIVDVICDEFEVDAGAAKSDVVENRLGLRGEPLMDWCMDCHAYRGASNECLTCHL